MRLTKPAKPGFRQLHRMETLGPETGSRFRQTKTGTRPGDSLSHMQTYTLLSTTLTQMPEASEHAKHQQHVRPHEQMPMHTTTTATHTQQHNNHYSTALATTTLPTRPRATS